MNKESERFLDRELLAHSLDIDAGEPELRLVRNMGLALRRGLFWIILAAIFGGIVGFFASGLLEKRYTSVAQVMIDTRVSVATEFAPVVSGLPTSTTTLESELEVLKSPDLVERIVDRFDLMNDPEFSEPETGAEVAELSEAELAVIRHEKTIAAVAEQRSIEQIGTISAVYAISFTTTDPVKSASLANALAEEYLNTTTAAKLRSLELSQGWLAERTGELQQDLTDLSVQLEQHILAAPYSPDEVETIKAKSLTVERRLRDRTHALPRIETELGRASVLSSLGRPVLAAREISNPGAELTLAMAGYDAGDAASVVGLESALDDAIRSLTAERDRTRVEIVQLASELKSMRLILTEQAKHDAEMHRIENDITVSEAIYQDFVAQLSRRTQQERYLDADARVIAEARPALDPSEPQSKLMAAVAAILAALVAVLVLVVSELRQTRMRTVHEIEEATGLRLIGVIPEAREDEVPAMLSRAGPNAFSPRLMRFARKLQASVRANTEAPIGSRRPESDKSPVRRAAVVTGVSANPDDGLSTSMLMLAVAYAEAGEKVLLIDTDFWASPYRSDYPRLKHDAEALLDPAAKEHNIVQTDWAELSLLPAISCSDNEGAPISAETFAEVLAGLAGSYDRILVDTAPLMQRMDVASLCRAADSVLLFVRWNDTTRNAVTSTLKLLSDVGVHASAVVATRVDTTRVKVFGEDELYFPRAATAG